MVGRDLGIAPRWHDLGAVIGGVGEEWVVGVGERVEEVVGIAGGGEEGVEDGGEDRER